MRGEHKQNLFSFLVYLPITESSFSVYLMRYNQHLHLKPTRFNNGNYPLQEVSSEIFRFFQFFPPIKNSYICLQIILIFRKYIQLIGKQIKLLEMVRSSEPISKYISRKSCCFGQVIEFSCKQSMVAPLFQFLMHTASFVRTSMPLFKNTLGSTV